MAYFPCDCHGGRYTGPQQTTYPALLGDTFSDRKKRRLCPACFHDVLKFAEEHLEEVGVDEENLNGCSICEQPFTGVAAFLTVYEKGQPRRDFFGRICDSCLPGTQLAFFGAQAAIPDLVA